MFVKRERGGLAFEFKGSMILNRPHSSVVTSVRCKCFISDIFCTLYKQYLIVNTREAGWPVIKKVFNYE